MIELNKNAPMPEHIDRSIGHSSLSALPKIAAIASLGVYEFYENSEPVKRYPVNNIELEKLEESAGYVVDACHTALADIGQLMAHVPENDCTEVLKTIGWTVTALAEIAEYASIQKSDFAYSLEQQAKKSPKK